jgi:hypothetical protein
MVDQKKQDLKLNRTNDKVMVGGKERVVYEGPRGGRYVKKGGEFVRVGKQAGGVFPSCRGERSVDVSCPSPRLKASAALVTGTSTRPITIETIINNKSTVGVPISNAIIMLQKYIQNEPKVAAGQTELTGQQQGKLKIMKDNTTFFECKLYDTYYQTGQGNFTKTRQYVSSVSINILTKNTRLPMYLEITSPVFIRKGYLIHVENIKSVVYDGDSSNEIIINVTEKGIESDTDNAKTLKEELKILLVNL